MRESKDVWMDGIGGISRDEINGAGGWMVVWAPGFRGRPHSLGHFALAVDRGVATPEHVMAIGLQCF